MAPKPTAVKPAAKVVTVSVTPKPAVKSKMIWADVILFVIQAIDHLALGGFIPQPYGAMIHSGISIYLRTRTSSPISGLIKLKELKTAA